MENMARHYFGGSVVAFEEAAAEPLGEGMASWQVARDAEVAGASRVARRRWMYLSSFWARAGTGKESVARLIPRCQPAPNSDSTRSIVPPWAAILLERDLMGYEPGAFAGATRSRAGKLELADKGTIFLDDFAGFR